MRGLWLLDDETFRFCVDAFSRFEFDQGRYEAFIERTSGRSGEPQLLVADGVARIPVVGMLVKESDFFLEMILGQGSTLYGDIVQAVGAANADPAVERIVLEIDSHGGGMDGFFDAAAAIAGSSKPTEAQVTGMAASAAFGLASQADRIVVNNALAMVGSVGIVTTRFIDEDRVEITSTEAPLKRKDVSTEEGIAAIRAELDPIHAEFAGIIAQGRGVSVDVVNSDFGRGGMIIAADALHVGMIDAIDSPSIPAGVRGTGTMANVTTESSNMDLTELKANHLDVYAAVLAEGVAKEHDRVMAHIEAAKGCKNLDLAAEFIESKDDFTSQRVQAKYMSARQNSVDISNRADDDKDLDKIDGSAGKTAGGDTRADANAKTVALFTEINSGLGIDPITA